MKSIARVFGAAVLAGTVGALLAGSNAATAQSLDERIVSFDVDVTVHADGSVEFVERIDYDFGTHQRHGIFRDLVNVQRFDSTHDRTYPLHVLDVDAVDAPEEFVIVDGDDTGDIRIRIGDPDRTITGRHVYTIRYRLDGVVNKQDPARDELYWNITGDDWGVPIEATTVTVRTETAIDQIDCFAGPAGSVDPCSASILLSDGRTGSFEQTSLDAGSQLTIVVGIEDVDGAAAEPEPVLKDRFSLAKAFEATPLTVGSTALLTLLFGGLIARTQFRVGRDRRALGAPTDIAFATVGAPSEPVPLFAGRHSPVEFVPPDGIRPGQLGVLKDEVAHTSDVSATIIDLAVRGYIRIEEIVDDDDGDVRDADVTDYRFVRLPKDGGLLAYESYLLTELFDRGPEGPSGPAAREAQVELSSLENKFAKSLAEVRSQLYADVVARGWYDARPDQVRTRWFLLGLGVGLAGGGLTFALARFTHFGLLGLPVVVAGLALMIGAKWMPRRTAAGHGVYRRVLGFQDFIENSEKHRAQWAERRNLFPEYLPYAIALGATKKWARTLESLGAPPPQAGGWYVGHSVYGWGAFSDRMGSFSSSTSTTLSSTPGGSGSSGFSGGSSGGGGGGGGGGSW
jgi:uncharacterized membrane protein YgcG